MSRSDCPGSDPPLPSSRLSRTSSAVAATSSSVVPVVTRRFSGRPGPAAIIGTPADASYMICLVQNPWFAHHIAVVRDIEDHRVLGLPARLERSEDASDAIVHEACQTVIGDLRLSDLGFVEVAAVIEESRDVA